MSFNDVNIRRKTRICLTYGLHPRFPTALTGDCIGDVYDFGRLAGHIRAGQDLLPQVILNERFVEDTREPSRIANLSHLPVMRSLQLIVAITPRGHAVLVVDGEIKEKTISSQDIAKLLAATCFQRSEMQVDGDLLMDWLFRRLQQLGICLDSISFGSDVHQCVFLGDSLEERLRSQTDSAEVNQVASQILYRGTVPIDSGSLLGIHIPTGLNNPGTTFVAHGRGVSLFSGWTKQLEHAFMLTAISTVAALGALRLARHEAFSAMALSQDATPASQDNPRRLVAQLADRLNEMQLDLSFGVETHIDSVLIPEMVVESFQRSLSEAVGIRESLDNTSRMLQRVGAVISARLSKLEAVDRDRIERRDRLLAVLLAAASLLALPPALLLAFFGINASQVRAARSIFDFHAYWGAYVLAWLPFVILVSVGSLLYARIRRRTTADTP